jgi:DNA-binding response OmpR family regulator
MLPGDDGLTLCRNLRANQPYDVPILMLTARGDEANRIVGLELSLSTRRFRALRHEHQSFGLI